MKIKDKQALLQLKTTIDQVDQLINSDTYDDIREDNSELFGLLQVLQSDLNNSVDFSENTKLDDLIGLADNAYQHPDDMLIASTLIQALNDNEFGVDDDTINHLKENLFNWISVKQYTSAILAQLQSLQY